MGSERWHPQAAPRRVRAITALLAALVLTAAAATIATWPDESRVWVGAGLLAALALAVLVLALMHLAATPQPLPLETPFGLPADLAATRDALTALQAQIEHAPVALWRVDAQGRTEPLNAAARRVLAPGGASDRNALLAQLARAAAPGRGLLAFDSERGHERALVAASALTLRTGGSAQAERLVALMPIESELETETLAAWQQLVHVLTHEIMNSLTPIASLSKTMQELLADPAHGSQDIATALDAIARRAAHLVAFVDSYRRVSRWPAPTLSAVRLEALLTHVEALIAPAWLARDGGAVGCRVEPATLELRADPAQLEQVLINLAKNAFEATASTPHARLDIDARLVRGGRLAITVADNGPGVASGDEARIFTPFYSTKAGGSGIGLTVVRNLVHGMGGTVRHAKRASGGACFVLTF
jgi:signal transduction histidine kinase